MKLIPLLILLIINNAIKAETLNVPDSYSTIQAAINASSDFDTVLVSAGFYQENIDFNGKNIVVTSTYIIDQDSTIISSTIIDGGQDGSVVIFENNENENAIIEGFYDSKWEWLLC